MKKSKVYTPDEIVKLAVMCFEKEGSKLDLITDAKMILKEAATFSRQIHDVLKKAPKKDHADTILIPTEKHFYLFINKPGDMKLYKFHSTNFVLKQSIINVSNNKITKTMKVKNKKIE